MRRILAPALLGLSLVAGGCAAGQDSVPRPDADVRGGATSATGIAALENAQTLDGEPFDVAVVADRPVALWFWAPWCTICRAEAPDIVEVVAELEAAGSPVVLLGVPGRGQTAEMDDFVEETGTGKLTHVVDSDGAIWRSFGVLTQPAFAFIDSEGSFEVVNGALGAEGLRERASRLTSGSS